MKDALEEVGKRWEDRRTRSLSFYCNRRGYFLKIFSLKDFIFPHVSVQGIQGDRTMQEPLEARRGYWCRPIIYVGASDPDKLDPWS